MSLSGVAGMCRQMYIKTVHYNGNIVAMKEMKSIPLTRSLMMELKTLKDLQHMNIVRFLGASLDQGQFVVLIFLWLQNRSRPALAVSPNFVICLHRKLQQRKNKTSSILQIVPFRAIFPHYGVLLQGITSRYPRGSGVWAWHGLQVSILINSRLKTRRNKFFLIILTLKLHPLKVRVCQIKFEAKYKHVFKSTILFHLLSRI